MSTGHVIRLAAFLELALHALYGFSPAPIMTESTVWQQVVGVQRAVFPQLADVLDVAGFGFSGWEGQV